MRSHLLLVVVAIAACVLAVVVAVYAGEPGRKTQEITLVRDGRPNGTIVW